MRIVDRVPKSVYDKWRSRLLRMVDEPYNLPVGRAAYQCGEWFCVKTWFEMTDDHSIVMLAMARPVGATFEDWRYYVDVPRLEREWVLYNDVNRIMYELSRAGF